MMQRNLYYLDRLQGLNEVMSAFKLSASVTVNDVTLREANQVVSFSVSEKIRIAEAIVELGVKQIQVGMPGVSNVDKETVHRLKKGALEARVEVVSLIYRGEWKRDLAACIESGADSIDMFYPLSEDKLRAKGVSIDEAIDTCLNAIEYAKVQGVPHITFCPYPAVRMDIKMLRRVIALSVEAGADMILVTDTYGTSSPAAMRFFLKELRESSDVPLGVHCHNDLGLALANTLAAVEGGAEMVEASVNGLGDRTGNCCLDEVIIALTAFYGYDLDLRTEVLYPLSKLVEKLSDIALPFGKPLVGENAFVHRHDDDVKSSLEVPSSTVPIEPSLVGNKRRIVLGGEYTGPITIRAKAEELGIDLSAEKTGQVLKSVRETLQGRKVPLTNEEFLSAIREVG